MHCPWYRMVPRVLVAGLSLLALGPGPARAERPLRVAVAANFEGPARAIAARFQESGGGPVQVVVGSTGKLAAQIAAGAPFDVFLAADRQRPARLDGEGAVLRRGAFSHLAIANPRLAPYGRAARQVLERLGLWERLRGRIVQGESVAQAGQMVESGAADLGLVAASQVLRPGRATQGSYWRVPEVLYDPIEQEAVTVREGERARAFAAFLRGPEARAILRAWGYAVSAPAAGP